MPIEILVPRFGWNMESGVFLGWLKQDGTTIQPGDALFKLEGDKAVQEVEAIDAGILRIPADGPKEGDTVAVGATVAFLEVSSSTPRAETGPERKSQPVNDPQPKPLLPGPLLRSGEGGALPAASPAVRRLARALSVDLAKIAGSGIGGRIDAGDLRAIETRPVSRASSPRARRVARERGVDLSRIDGTGRNGRIRERDVLALGAGKALSSTRQAIAAHLLHSVKSTVPVTLTTTADVTELVKWREQRKGTSGVVPTYTDFIIRITAETLQKHPALNARWVGERLEIASQIDIGVAVDTPAGLMVPVIRDVSALSLVELERRTKEIAEKARLRQLSASAMQGGSFTITNLGRFGIDAFTPIINWPEIAILGIGRIAKQPAVFEGQVAIREIVTLSLTFDHRAVDGAPAAAFLQAVVAGLVSKPEASAKE